MSQPAVDQGIPGRKPREQRVVSGSLTEKVRAPAPWFADAVDEIERYCTLPEDWDGYKARSVDAETAAAALGVVRTMIGQSAPRPVLAPTPRGTISWEWDLPNADLHVVIEFTSPTSAELYVEDDENEREVSVRSDFSAIREALARVGAHPSR